jgi:glycosyltransferase involved in cell wall biosynthesis
MNKILFVGANTLLVPHIEALVKDNKVVVCESSEINLPHSVIVYKLTKSFFGLNKGFGEVSLPYYQKGLSEVLATEKPEVIVVMDFIRLWYWQVLWYRLRHRAVRVVLYSETQRLPVSVLSKIAFYLFWFIYKISEKLISSYVVYTDLGKQFAVSFGVSAPIRTLPVPVDVDFFKPNPSKDNTSDTLRVLMNARFVPYKRHVDLLEAMLILKNKNLKISLTCVGRGGDIEWLKKEVSSRGLDDVVDLKSSLSRDEVLAVYQTSDILVLPSDGEAIGMVVPEAMACGLPTVTSDQVGANVYVKEGETGLVVSVKNPVALSLAIESFLDKDKLSLMSQKARVQAERFSVESLKNEAIKTLVTF